MKQLKTMTQIMIEIRRQMRVRRKTKVQLRQMLLTPERIREGKLARMRFKRQHLSALKILAKDPEFLKLFNIIIEE